MPDTEPVAILLAAGNGRRLRPITAAVPKELFPLAGRTVLDNVVDDIVHGGYTRIIVVTSDRKPAIDAYLAAELGPRCRADGVTVEALRQCWPGTAGALASTFDTIGSADVFVTWGDEVFWPPTRAREVSEQFHRTGRSTIATTVVVDDDVPLCGIVEWQRESATPGHAAPIGALVEKPDPTEVHSRAASVGGQLLTKDCLGFVGRHAAAQREAGADEASLALALADYVAAGGPVDGIALQCAWMETGSWRGYARAFAHAESALAGGGG